MSQAAWPRRNRPAPRPSDELHSWHPAGQQWAWSGSSAASLSQGTAWWSSYTPAVGLVILVPKDDIVMEYVTLDTFRRLRLGRRTSPGAYGMLALATVVVVARWLHECHRGKCGASTVQGS